MNQTLTNIGIAAVVALVVSLGAFWFTQPATPIAQLGNTTTAIPEPGGTVLPNGEVLPNPSTSDYTVERVYDAMFALGLWDGTSNPVHIQAVRTTFVASATTTPCVMQSPFNASSTIANSAFTPAATTTAYGISIGTAYSLFGTPTTFFGGVTQAAGSSNNIVSGESATTTGLGVIVPPSGYIVDTATIGPWTTGSCTTIFQTIN